MKNAPLIILVNFYKKASFDEEITNFSRDFFLFASQLVISNVCRKALRNISNIYSLFTLEKSHKFIY